MRQTRLKALIAAAAAVLLNAGMIRAAAEGSFTRTLTVSGAIEMEVTTGSGHINVRRGGSSSVHIQGTIRAGKGWRFNEEEAERKVRALESNPPIEQQGSFIRIGRIDDPELRRDVSISYELEVPEETRLRAETGSGSQTISGLHGPVKAETGSGGLKVEEIGDEVTAGTGSGEVQLEAIHGRVHASTGSGSIRGSGLGGAFTASTGSGDIRLELSGPGDGKVDTGSGSVELRGVRGSLRVRTGSGGITAEGEPAGEWSLHTGSGGVTIRVPSGTGFDLDAHTDSGRISSDHPITVQGSVGRGELRGKVGEGGVRIELRTGSGNIHVE